MKKLGFLLLAGCSLTLHAQVTGALAKMDRIAAQAVLTRSSLRAVPPVKAVSFPPPTYYNHQFARMEKIVQHPVMAQKSHQPMLVSYDYHTDNRIKQYQQVMKTFLAFKQQAGPFLYYQTKNRRLLEPEEKRQWLERIYHTKQQLASLRGIVSVKERSLQAAYTYLNEVLRAVAPDVALFAVPQPYQERPDRVYQEDEFFLHAPQFSPWVRMLQRAGLNVGGIKPLPQNLKIVVFNDDFYYLNAMKALHQKGKLFPGSSVSFLRDAYELLHLILRGNIMPDIIITDICSVNTGGLELTQELRSAGYNGVIIAFTAYKENEISGELFMQYGFDGIISNYYNSYSSTRTRLPSALQYYFYYRNLHGWMR